MVDTSYADLISQLGKNTIIDPHFEVILSNRPSNSKRGLYIGSDCTIFSRNKIILGDMAANPDANVIIKDRVMINTGCYISGEGGLEIEDFVLIGPNNCILSAGHNYSDPQKKIQEQGLSYGKILIKKDAWIGASCVILEGVTIGEGAVVGAGSVVTNDIPAWAVAVGNPAKTIKYRGAELDGKKKAIIVDSKPETEIYQIHKGYQNEIQRMQSEISGLHKSYQRKIDQLHDEMAQIHNGYRNAMQEQERKNNHLPVEQQTSFTASLTWLKSKLGHMLKK